MKRKWIWYPTVFLMFLGLLVFGYGFFNAFSIGVEATEKTETTPRISTEIVTDISTQDQVFFSLGDSLARGTGDLEEGGFVGRTVRKLETLLQNEIGLFNVAVEGLKTEGLLIQLENQQLIEGIKQADLIFLAIGGNDLRTVQNIPENQKQTVYEEVLKAYLEDLKLVIELIQEKNEFVEIIFVGLYHLDYSDLGVADRPYVLNWNYETQLLLEQYNNTLFMPTYDLFKKNHAAWLSFDQLHPNALGHEGISNRILEVLNFPKN